MACTEIKNVLNESEGQIFRSIAISLRGAPKVLSRVHTLNDINVQITISISAFDISELDPMSD